MKILVNEEQKLERKFLRLIMKLPPEQVLGVTTMLGVKLVEDTTVEEDIVEENSVEENIVEENETAADSIKSSQEDENIPTFANPILKEDLEVKEDKEDSTSNDEDKKDNARSAMDILYDAFDKFRALNIQQKKSLIKIMKAGG